MNTVFRNDPIKLHIGVKEDDFERFAAEELLPFFGKKYAGPTGNTQAFLASQRLLKGTKDRRKYKWLTVWSGPAERVQGASFELVLGENNQSAGAKKAGIFWPALSGQHFGRGGQTVGGAGSFSTVRRLGAAH